MPESMLGRALRAVSGPQEDLWRKLGGPDGEKWLARLKKLLRGEPTGTEKPSDRMAWDNDVLYLELPVTTETTGEQWIRSLKNEELEVGPDAKKILRSSTFVPTWGVKHTVAILCDRKANCRDEAVCDEGMSRGWHEPHLEVACILRRMLTNDMIRAMGLWNIIVMHQPVEDGAGYMSRLCLSPPDAGDWLHTARILGNSPYHSAPGFVFEVLRKQAMLREA